MVGIIEQEKRSIKKQFREKAFRPIKKKREKLRRQKKKLTKREKEIQRKKKQVRQISVPRRSVGFQVKKLKGRRRGIQEKFGSTERFVEERKRAKKRASRKLSKAEQRVSRQRRKLKGIGIKLKEARLKAQDRRREALERLEFGSRVSPVFGKEERVPISVQGTQRIQTAQGPRLVTGEGKVVGSGLGGFGRSFGEVPSFTMPRIFESTQSIPRLKDVNVPETRVPNTRNISGRNNRTRAISRRNNRTRTNNRRTVRFRG